MEQIEREPTTDEKRDFTPLRLGAPRKKKNAQQLFNEELGLEMQKAIKKKLPFADKVARDDFKDYYEGQVKISIRKNGFLEPSEIKPLKMNWAKYSDLKNFEVIKEDERLDENLSKRNPGLNVMVKLTKYKFAGYSNVYTIMESGPDAVLRAKANLKKLDSETGAK